LEVHEMTPAKTVLLAPDKRFVFRPKHPQLLDIAPPERR
jgi:hypothetical protein